MGQMTLLDFRLLAVALHFHTPAQDLLSTLREVCRTYRPMFSVCLIDDHVVQGLPVAAIDGNYTVVQVARLALSQAPTVSYDLYKSDWGGMVILFGHPICDPRPESAAPPAPGCFRDEPLSD